MKLNDMGTTGLVQWVISGGWKMRGARRGQAEKVIAKRYRSPDAIYRFRAAVNDAWHREATKQ